MHRLCAIPVLLAASGLALAACSTEALPFEESFSGDCEWPAAESAQAVIGCFEETYRIVVKRRHGQLSLYGLDTSTDALHFEADGSVVRGPRPPLSPLKYLSYGVGCWADANRGYVLSVSVDGSYAIFRDPPATDRFVLLAEGTGAARELRSGRLGADCVARDGTTTLVLSVDAREILVARDENGFDSFEAIGFLVDASGRAEVRFDEAEARELSDAAAVALAAREPPPRSANLPVRDDFSDPASGWATGEDRSIALEYSHGGYRMRLKGSEPQRSLLRIGGAVKRVAVEATARKEGGPPSTALGLVCDAGHRAGGYTFLVSPEGGYAIVKEDREGLKVLGEGATPPFGAGGKAIRLQATCAGARGGVARLAFEANGRRVATVTDPQGLATFTAVGLYVSADRPSASVVFDDFVARALD